MEEFGSTKLFMFIAFTQACLVIFVVTRMNIQPATAPADKTDFDLAATAAVGTVVSPELPDIEDPLVVAPSIPGVSEPESADRADAEPADETDAAQ